MYRATTSSVSSSWNAATSGATQVVAKAKTVIKKVDVVGSALKKVAVEACNFAIGDMIRACSQGISLSCGAELAMMTPWGKFAKAGKLAFKIAGKMDDAIGASRSLAKKCSFAGKTLVLMADGSRKSIEDIKVDDRVMASDPQTDEQAARRVEAVHVHHDTVTDIEVDGEVVTTTEDHPFWSVDDQTFERADELAAGERVLGADGQPRTVTDAINTTTARPALAYNLSIQGIHTYHVGTGDILVHNTCSIAGAAGGADDAANITKRYSRPSGATTPAQREAVQGKPCVDCGEIAERQVADHIDPLVKEYYRTGAIDRDRMRSLDAVQPQCPTCSSRQGAAMSRYSIEMRKQLGLE
ncbi:HINT domain-containing protein [Mumia sp. zg.B21]|uniref:polymorphic toxin-type HINT domain-containing protein n=1 Tax=Mumia sp. zg.B21 TaxID=2855447 RepID=UPI001C6EF424|nr:polymorphic toxin-type HINT domain-containing protein [Mumia sp. zg.B21]MBW9210506.1 HINT domain-containing protein [Mumia sp. zg.B21]